MAGTDALDEMDIGMKLVLLGGAITVVAAFLPWISIDAGFFSETVTGIDGDGVFTLVLGGAAMALVYVRDWDRVTVGAVVVLGALVALIGVVYISDPLTGVDTSGMGGEILESNVSTEIGLYLTAIGGLVLIGGGIKGHQLGSTGDGSAAPAAPAEN